MAYYLKNVWKNKQLLFSNYADKRRGSSSPCTGLLLWDLSAAQALSQISVQKWTSLRPLARQMQSSSLVFAVCDPTSDSELPWSRSILVAENLIQSQRESFHWPQQALEWEIEPRSHSRQLFLLSSCSSDLHSRTQSRDLIVVWHSEASMLAHFFLWALKMLHWVQFCLQMLSSHHSDMLCCD